MHVKNMQTHGELHKLPKNITLTSLRYTGQWTQLLLYTADIQKAVGTLLGAKQCNKEH